MDHIVITRRVMLRCLFPNTDQTVFDNCDYPNKEAFHHFVLSHAQNQLHKDPRNFSEATREFLKRLDETDDVFELLDETEKYFASILDNTTTPPVETKLTEHKPSTVSDCVSPCKSDDFKSCDDQDSVDLIDNFRNLSMSESKSTKRKTGVFDPFIEESKQIEKTSSIQKNIDFFESVESEKHNFQKLDVSSGLTSDKLIPTQNKYPDNISSLIPDPNRNDTIVSRRVRSIAQKDLISAITKADSNENEKTDKKLEKHPSNRSSFSAPTQYIEDDKHQSRRSAENNHYTTLSHDDTLSLLDPMSSQSLFAYTGHAQSSETSYSHTHNVQGRKTYKGDRNNVVYTVAEVHSAGRDSKQHREKAENTTENQTHPSNVDRRNAHSSSKPNDSYMSHNSELGNVAKTPSYERSTSVERDMNGNTYGSDRSAAIDRKPQSARSADAVSLKTITDTDTRRSSVASHQSNYKPEALPRRMSHDVHLDDGTRYSSGTSQYKSYYSKSRSTSPYERKQGETGDNTAQFRGTSHEMRPSRTATPEDGMPHSSGMTYYGSYKPTKSRSGSPSARRPEETGDYAAQFHGMTHDRMRSSRSVTPDDGTRQSNGISHRNFYDTKSRSTSPNARSQGVTGDSTAQFRGTTHEIRPSRSVTPVDGTRQSSGMSHRNFYDTKSRSTSPNSRLQGVTGDSTAQSRGMTHATPDIGQFDNAADDTYNGNIRQTSSNQSPDLFATDDDGKQQKNQVWNRHHSESSSKDDATDITSKHYGGHGNTTTYAYSKTSDVGATTHMSSTVFGRTTDVQIPASGKHYFGSNNGQNQSQSGTGDVEKTGKSSGVGTTLVNAAVFGLKLITGQYKTESEINSQKSTLISQHQTVSGRPPPSKLGEKITQQQKPIESLYSQRFAPSNKVSGAGSAFESKVNKPGTVSQGGRSSGRGRGTKILDALNKSRTDEKPSEEMPEALPLTDALFNTEAEIKPKPKKSPGFGHFNQKVKDKKTASETSRQDGENSAEFGDAHQREGETIEEGQLVEVKLNEEISADDVTRYVLQMRKKEAREREKQREKEALELERQRDEEARERERQEIKEAQELERQREEEARERERQKIKEAQERERQKIKEAQELERQREEEARERERQKIKEAQERERQKMKEAQEQERQKIKEAQEQERQKIKEARERERQKEKEAREHEKQKEKEAQEQERQKIKEAQERERQRQKEARERENQQKKEAQERERQRHAIEREKQREKEEIQRREDKERDELRKEAIERQKERGEQEKIRKEAEEKEKLMKESEEKEKALYLQILKVRKEREKLEKQWKAAEERRKRELEAEKKHSETAPQQIEDRQISKSEDITFSSYLNREKLRKNREAEEKNTADRTLKADADDITGSCHLEEQLNQNLMVSGDRLDVLRRELGLVKGIEHPDADNEKPTIRDSEQKRLEEIQQDSSNISHPLPKNDSNVKRGTYERNESDEQSQKLPEKVIEDETKVIYIENDPDLAPGLYAVTKVADDSLRTPFTKENPPKIDTYESNEWEKPVLKKEVKDLSFEERRVNFFTNESNLSQNLRQEAGYQSDASSVKSEEKSKIRSTKHDKFEAHTDSRSIESRKSSSSSESRTSVQDKFVNTKRGGATKEDGKPFAKFTKKKDENEMPYPYEEMDEYFGDEDVAPVTDLIEFREGIKSVREAVTLDSDDDDDDDDEPRAAGTTPSSERQSSDDFQPSPAFEAAANRPTNFSAFAEFLASVPASTAKAPVDPSHPPSAAFEAAANRPTAFGAFAEFLQATPAARVSQAKPKRRDHEDRPPGKSNEEEPSHPPAQRDIEIIEGIIEASPSPCEEEFHDCMDVVTASKSWPLDDVWNEYVKGFNPFKFVELFPNPSSHFFGKSGNSSNTDLPIVRVFLSCRYPDKNKAEMMDLYIHHHFNLAEACNILDQGLRDGSGIEHMYGGDFDERFLFQMLFVSNRKEIMAAYSLFAESASRDRPDHPLTPICIGCFKNNCVIKCSEDHCYCVACLTWLFVSQKKKKSKNMNLTVKCTVCPHLFDETDLKGVFTQKEIQEMLRKRLLYRIE